MDYTSNNKRKNSRKQSFYTNKRENIDPESGSTETPHLP